jgi:hypothetical protein
VKAWLKLRHTAGERLDCFRAGLSGLGYEVMDGVTHEPGPNDIFVTWSRIGQSDEIARLFHSRGNQVLVVENATWGNDFLGSRWLTIAHDFHNTAGCFPVGAEARWDRLGATLLPWRSEGETVILMQRGIGPPETAMPRGWGHGLRGRIRPHPGKLSAVTLADDLANAGRVITWGSGAAVKALMMGIPVESHMPNWIGEQDNTDAGRLDMFRRLAWAQWKMEEIECGDPFRWLLL